jgi:hypothetical protein
MGQVLLEPFSPATNAPSPLLQGIEQDVVVAEPPLYAVAPAQYWM